MFMQCKLCKNKSIYFSASVEPEYETKTWQPGLEFEAAKKDSDKKWEEKEDFWKTDQGAYSSNTYSFRIG